MGRWSVAPAARSHCATMTSEPTTRDAWTIRPARLDELPALGAIEREAGRRFDDVAWLADVPELLAPIEALRAACDRDQVWVATSTRDGALVGFAYVDVVDGAAHLQELDVLPSWGGRGIGRALIAAVFADATARGLAAVTLTTFRDVPWNGPFYARLGFRVVDRAALTPGLAAIMAHETSRGLPEERRVVMRCELPRPLLP
jgi:ribosomal protein S18 acetylase RimI-like enzyme